MVTFTRRIQKSRSFCNLTPWKSRSGQFGVKWGQVFKLTFFYKKMCIGVSLTSGFQKCHFYFCATTRNARNWNLKKNDVINGYRFLAIRVCKPLIEILSWNFACEEVRWMSKTLFSVFWKFWKLLILTSVFKKKIDSLNFGGQYFITLKIWDIRLKEG